MVQAEPYQRDSHLGMVDPVTGKGGQVKPVGHHSPTRHLGGDVSDDTTDGLTISVDLRNDWAVTSPGLDDVDIVQW